MKSITQLDSYGCGLACVSFLANINYQEVSNLDIKKQAQSQGFTCKELVRLLLQFGLHYEYKYLKPRLKNKIYNDGVIVFIKRSKKYSSGHYLVRFKDQWMDPWINFSPDSNLNDASSGFRKRLPEKPIYALFPISS